MSALRHPLRGRPTLLAAVTALLLPALGACAGGDEGSPAGGALSANRVVAYAPVIGPSVTEAEWPYFFHPEWALGPPGGTLDTASLGYDKAAGDAAGGSITLGLGTSGDPTARVCAVDGAGDDLAVFENAFPTVDPITMIDGTVSEVAILALAEDAAGPWYEYPYSIDGGYELIQPQRYSGLAGVTPTAQGGDRFDLTVLIAAHSLAPDFRTCYVRLTDGGTLTTPYDLDDYGNTQTDLHSSGADIDAVAPLHFVEAPGLAQ